MFTFKLSISFQNARNFHRINQVFDELLGALIKNGQIIDENQPLYSKNFTLNCIVITPEKDSFKKQYAHKHVKKSWDELEKNSGNKIKIEYLGKDKTVVPTFHCKKNCKRSYYILYTNYFFRGSPIFCGDCFGSIPLYQLPSTYHDEYYDIWSWQRYYKACDELQMGCVVGEKFGLRQMSDYKSSLTQQGLKICRNLEKLTKKNVYYYLFNYRKISLSKDKQRRCPSCGGEWFLKKPLHEKFEFQCKKCKLFSSLTCNT